MLHRRMTRLPFLGAWLVLVAGMIYGLVQVSAGAVALGLVLTGLGWLGLFPIYVWRANDLGRAPDEAVWLVLPVVGPLYGLRLLGATPSDKLRAKRLRRWQGQITGVGAVLLGARRLVAVSWLALPLALLFGVAQTLSGEELSRAVRWVLEQPLETQQLVSQGIGLVAGLLAIYSLFQVLKRHKTTRISWLPTLFMLPLALVAGSILLARVGGPSTQPAVLALVDSAWMLLFLCFGGAALMVAWVTLAEQLERGEGVDAGAVVRRMVSRTADVAAPYGAKTHAVLIGMQVVIPGIFYALQMAFVGISAVLEPEERALARSARLTYGIRSRVLKALLGPFVLSMAIGSGATYAFEGMDGLIQSMMVPGSGGLWPKLIGDVASLLIFGATTLGMVEMFRQRAERFRKKDAAEGKEPVAEADPDAAQPGARGALVAVGALTAVAGGALLAVTGSGAALLSVGVAVVAVPLLVGPRGA